MGWQALALAGSLLLAAASSHAGGLDLSAVESHRLDNGLRVLLLEDHALPVVSVQMLYAIGSRHEVVGHTGLAHFLEHMAFRSTESFASVTRPIYAVGGEWHGYTWLDQTTYYSTVPADQLDLLLRIEAERLTQVVLDPDVVRAEAGAVLAEMHGYDNDPASRLADAVAAASFQQHPYRYNVIGWESDVAAVEHADLVDFYARHYRASNAVLVVVGAFEAAAVRELIAELFGSAPALPASEGPRTREPEQRGERRLEIADAGPRRFRIAYRAPAVRDPDFPALLLLQALLAGSDGANFQQDGSPVAAAPGSRLHGAAAEIAAWALHTADPYLLTISGRAADDETPAQIEARVEAAISALREQGPSAAELASAREQVRRELVFDIQTTEDAGHQLAYYAGLDALEVLLGLPRELARVTPQQVQELAGRRLQPWQRTVGWTSPDVGPPATPAASTATQRLPAAAAESRARISWPDAAAPTSKPLARTAQRPAPLVRRLASGLTAIAQPIPGRTTAHLQLVVPTRHSAAGAELDTPLLGHSSLAHAFLPGEESAAVATQRAALLAGSPAEPGAPAHEPMQRLEQELLTVAGVRAASSADASPVVAVAAGGVDPEAFFAALEQAFDAARPQAARDSPAPFVIEPSRSVQVPAAAQAALGYAVPAPGPADPASLAWRALLYVFAHAYDGRLGREAIAARGLLYYVGTQYRHDTDRGLVTLSMGVDPHKLAPLRALFGEELARLASSPPSEEEVEEARRHLIGRRLSAAQSPAELTTALADEWLSLGRLESDTEFSSRVEALTREDVLAAIPGFVSGVTIAVVPES